MRAFTSADPATRRKQLARRTLWAERILTAFMLVALALGHGNPRIQAELETELGVLVAIAMVLLTAGLAWRSRLSGEPWSFALERLPQAAAHAVWLGLLPVVALFGLPGFVSAGSPIEAALAWTELMFWVRTVAVALRIIRLIAAARTNPAIVFVASFALLVAIGTLLLMLPVARAQPEGNSQGLVAPPLVALFTATSATCVTGLVVVDTGTYWSRTGQTIILALIQLGGLGIMTFGGFVALGQRRGFLVRESVFMGKLLEAQDVHAVRGLIRSILLFTLASELIGAVLLSTLAPVEGPWSERLYFGTFHAISAFCNAGFALPSSGMLDQGAKWQVFGVIAPLIVIGGLGFEVLRNVTEVVSAPLRRSWAGHVADRTELPPRLTATSRLVLTTTAALLAAGALAFFILEADNTLGGKPLAERAADTWFQSVTFRTAGFNTVDFERVNPGTRLVGIVLMFIGGSPGSTAGGIRTTVFALLVLASAATVRGRERVEVGGRTVPESFLRRAAVVSGMALAGLLTSTLLIVIFEQQPHRFLDHLFEATSALGTVGLSTVGTSQLQPASQLVVTVTMFVGRVGPLTMLVALARQRPGQKYEYPTERVMLG